MVGNINMGHLDFYLVGNSVNSKSFWLFDAMIGGMESI